MTEQEFKDLLNSRDTYHTYYPVEWVRRAWIYDDAAYLNYRGYLAELGANECCYTYEFTLPDGQRFAWSSMEDESDVLIKQFTVYVAEQVHWELMDLYKGKFNKELINE